MYQKSLLFVGKSFEKEFDEEYHSLSLFVFR